MRRQLIFKFFLLVLTILACFNTGCLSGASPGMKVLKITGEQYYNDAVRYLKENHFIFDKSKISTSLKNIEKNSSGLDSQTKKKIKKMQVYLTLLNEYANIYRNGKRPDKDSLSKVWKNLKDENDKDYIFLKLFYLHIKSFIREGLDNKELLNLYSLKRYFEKNNDYVFIFGFGNDINDFASVKYFINSTFFQAGYSFIALDNLNTSLEENVLDYKNLLLGGELYYKMGLYEKSVDFLKYFRLPTLSEFVWRDYALSMLEKIYKDQEKETDMKVVKDKKIISISNRFDSSFAYLTQEDKDFYYQIYVEKNKDILMDMLDINDESNNYMLDDFDNIKQYELVKSFKTISKDINLPEVNIPFIYNYIEKNEEVLNNGPVFLLNDNKIHIISDLDKSYFIRINGVNLKRLENAVFACDLKKYKDKEIKLEIESSDSETGLNNWLYLMNGVYDE